MVNIVHCMAYCMEMGGHEGDQHFLLQCFLDSCIDLWFTGGGHRCHVNGGLLP